MKPLIRHLIDRYIPDIRRIPLQEGLRFLPTWKTVPTSAWYTRLLRNSSDDSGKPLRALAKKEEGYSQGCLWPPYVRYPFDPTNETITHCFLDWFERRIGPYLTSPDQLGVEARTGRLCCACTVDGKRRLFAVGNYVNQRLLFPLHQWCASVLKTIPMDGTFNQTDPLDRLAGVPGTVHSIDLKSTTDRQTVSFVAGQPLGYYSSWPLFALSHHLVVWVAAEQAYPGKRFDKYAVLGDDVIIADDRVNDAYSRLIHRFG
ncbi:RNA-dependent RNA polymerase, mitoviral [Corchorus olitorius]|uniref:RNA-dependent RNA polymerase, mitoviral n=1 Tax=Corchorus olitorius TaxID=93759 RepID=A0A1R3L0Z0_9ROSI|nr:RNA-dependent RNA polymerase, mitoviral [Corchorus olitorius]